MSRWRRQVLAGLWLGLASLPLAAGEARSRLDRFLDGLSSLRAEFVQIQLGPDARERQRLTGSLAVQRPGRLRWETGQAPAGQLIVADGKTLWVYDRDLAQVSARAFEARSGDSPLLLLVEARQLQQNFDITEAQGLDGPGFVELRPKQRADFEKLRLAFDGDGLAMMELYDNFGQITRLEFTRVQRNAALEAAAFQFAPPPGVDVIGQPAAPAGP